MKTTLTERNAQLAAKKDAATDSAVIKAHEDRMATNSLHLDTAGICKKYAEERPDMWAKIKKAETPSKSPLNQPSKKRVAQPEESVKDYSLKNNVAGNATVL